MKRFSLLDIGPTQFFIILMTISLVLTGYTMVGGAREIDTYTLAFIASSIAILLIGFMNMRNANNIAFHHITTSDNWLNSDQFGSLLLAEVSRVEEPRPNNRKATILRCKDGTLIGFRVLKVRDVPYNFDNLHAEELIRLLKIYADSLGSLERVNATIVLEKTPEAETFKFIIYSIAGSEEVVEERLQAVVPQLTKRLDEAGIKCEEAGTRSDDLLLRIGLPLRSQSKWIQPRIGSFLTLAIISIIACVLNFFILGGGLFAYSLLTSNGFMALTSLFSIFGLNNSVIGSACIPGRGYAIRNGTMLRRIGEVLNDAKTNGDKDEEYVECTRLYKVQEITTFMKPLSLNNLYMTLKNMNDMIANEENFCIALHLQREETYPIRKTMQRRMDNLWTDAEVGGVKSHARKAEQYEAVLDRMEGRLEEKTFRVSIVAGLRVIGSSVEAINARLDSLEPMFKSRLDSLHFNVERLKAVHDLIQGYRMFYLPPLSSTLEILFKKPMKQFLTLTFDFAWLSPHAFERRPLLPNEGIYLGLDKRGRKRYWPYHVLPNPHLLILGMMGMGKTTLARTIIARAKRRPATIIVIDPKAEYIKLTIALGGKVVNFTDVKINPLLLSGLSPMERAKTTVEMLGYALGLKTEEQVLMRRKILHLYSQAGVDANKIETWSDQKLRETTITHLYNTIKAEVVGVKVLSNEERDRLIAAAKMGDMRAEWLLTLHENRLAVETLLYKLEPIATGAFSFDRTDVTVAEILASGELVTLSFSHLVEGGEAIPLSHESQKIIVWNFLEQLESILTALGVHEEVRAIVVIDEAHLFIKPRGVEEEPGKLVAVDPPLSRHMRLMRKFGAAYIVVTHIARDIPTLALQGAGSIITFGSTRAKYLRWCEEELNMHPRDVEDLKWFNIGEIFMQVSGDPRPLQLTIDPEKTALTEKPEKKAVEVVSA